MSELHNPCIQRVRRLARATPLLGRAARVLLVVLGLEPMLRRLTPKSITLVLRLKPDLPSIHADPSRIEQVIMNLVLNARDAMPEGGQLTIEALAQEVDELEAAGQPDMNPGLHSVIVVSDTGTGIEEHDRALIFDPFFSTKGSSGTGQGLATVYGIVNQSKGCILLDTELGHGTTGRVLLPAVAEEPFVLTPTPALNSNWRGSESVLVCDDNSSVAQVVASMLTVAGYQVFLTSHPDEALSKAAELGPELDLLVTDVIMPSMNGPKLVSRVSELCPNSRALPMSGYAWPDEEIVDAKFELLAKPFRRDQLLMIVRRVLDESGVRQ